MLTTVISLSRRYRQNNNSKIPFEFDITQVDWISHFKTMFIPGTLMFVLLRHYLL